MHRIDDPSATTTFPTPAPSGTPGFFTGGDPSTGTQATILDADWANTIQEEIANVVLASGLTLDKTNNSQLLLALNSLFLPRVVVTAPLTLYVNPTTGNDSNTGTSAGAPFLTLGAAIAAVYTRYNWNGFGGTIQLADGNYNYTVAGGFAGICNGQPLGMPLGGLTIHGNSSLPDNVQITATNANALGFTGISVLLDGVSWTATGTTWTIGLNSGVGLMVNQGAGVNIQNCRMKNCGMFPCRVQNGGVLGILGSNNKVTGSSPYGLTSLVGGYIWAPSVTIDVTGFSTTQGNFYTDQARIEGGGMTFTGSGSCTGPRYAAWNNGAIVTGGGGASYFPGSSAGVIATGGQYS